MLVMTRKPGDEFLIGEDVRVRVVSVSGSKVRIGVIAPRDVAVVRTDARNKTPHAHADTMRRDGARQFTERTWTP